MRVAIVFLTSGGLSGGSRKYLEHLLPRFADDPRVRGLDVFLAPDAAHTFDAPAGIAVRSWPVNDLHRRGLRKAVAALKPDVVFVPTARWVDFGPIPVTVMVRNMEPMVVPLAGNSTIDGAKNLLRRYTARTSCERADRVIAVSGFVQRYLEHRWSIQSDKIAVVYHGVEPPLPRSESIKPAALADLSEGEPFVFTAGSIRPARGLEDLIGAIKLLASAGRNTRAVIAGAPTSGSEGYQRRLSALIRAEGLSAHLLFAGSLSRAEMAWCFHHCSVFAMTTKAEACPNTALEALSYQTTIISAEVDPLPEILGDAALYYRAADPEALATLVRHADALEPAERQLLRARAGRRAAKFEWSTTAERTIEELSRCARGMRMGVAI